jgi:hypothetical protein
MRFIRPGMRAWKRRMIDGPLAITARVHDLSISTRSVDDVRQARVPVLSPGPARRAIY